MYDFNVFFFKHFHNYTKLCAFHSKCTGMRTNVVEFDSVSCFCELINVMTAFSLLLYTNGSHLTRKLATAVRVRFALSNVSRSCFDRFAGWLCRCHLWIESHWFFIIWISVAKWIFIGRRRYDQRCWLWSDRDEKLRSCGDFAPNYTFALSEK